MRRTAGAARPASAALMRSRRDGDPPTLRGSLIRMLPGKGVACARDARNLAMLRQPGWHRRASESLRPSVACRLLCERSELRLAPLSLAVLGAVDPLRELGHLMVAS